MSQHHKKHSPSFCQSQVVGCKTSDDYQNEAVNYPCNNSPAKSGVEFFFFQGIDGLIIIRHNTIYLFVGNELVENEKK